MAEARQYELVYITPPDTTEEAIAELQQQITSIVERFGGTFEHKETTRRRLAYEINRHREGIYVLNLLNGSGGMTAEIDRRLRVLDTVIRHMIVRVDEELAAADRAQKRRKEATVARRVRRGLPPEPTDAERSRRHEEEDDLEVGMDLGER